jgi:hypothetical protein
MKNKQTKEEELVFHTFKKKKKKKRERERERKQAGQKQKF